MLEEFAASDLGARYPQTALTWQRAWQCFTPFLAFPPMLRRVVYTTNAIESLNYQLRKITKNGVKRCQARCQVGAVWG